MGFSGIPTREYDGNGNLVSAMCCICFEFYESVPAREGGMWVVDPTDNKMVDICVYCNALEYLWLANVMGA